MRRVLFTLVLAAGGGGLFALAGLPAGWMSGAMIAVGIASISGAPTLVPDRLRDIVFVFLGVSMGSGVTPETLHSVAVWPFSILALVLVMAAIIYSGTVYLSRVSGWSRASGFYASVPGALSMVIAMSLQTPGVDVRQVAVAQSLRLFALVAVLPILITAFEDVPIAASAASAAEFTLRDLAILLGAGICGALICKKLGLPAGLLTGALLASAVLYGSSTIEARLPQELLIPGFIILGGLIGSRFASATWASLRAIALTSMVAFLLAMAISLVASAAASYLLGVPFGQTLLAFAPGGLEAMTLMAFALDLDPAYVAAHQVMRYIFIALATPWLLRIMTGTKFDAQDR